MASIAVAAAVDSPQPAQVHLLQTDANQSPAPVAAVTASRKSGAEQQIYVPNYDLSGTSGAATIPPLLRWPPA